MKIIPNKKKINKFNFVLEKVLFLNKVCFYIFFKNWRL